MHRTFSQQVFPTLPPPPDTRGATCCAGFLLPNRLFECSIFSLDFSLEIDRSNGAACSRTPAARSLAALAFLI